MTARPAGGPRAATACRAPGAPRAFILRGRPSLAPMADLPDKRTAFVDWYLAVVEAADLSDKRYGVKGMNVWTRYGFLARRNLDRVLIREIEASGAEGGRVPRADPRDRVREGEGAHQRVRRRGLLGHEGRAHGARRPPRPAPHQRDRDVPDLRALGPVASGPAAQRLPDREHVPYETKTTRPFVRVREIHFFEEHSCQLDEAAATERVGSNLAAFRAWPRRSACRISPSADRNGTSSRAPTTRWRSTSRSEQARTLQIGTVHHYRDNFSVPYEIGYEAADGISGARPPDDVRSLRAAPGSGRRGPRRRSRGHFPDRARAVRGGHRPDPRPRDPRGARDGVGRDRGPPRARRGAGPSSIAATNARGRSTIRWELKGVPLRLEVGAAEAAARRATAVDRLGRKSFVSMDALEAEVAERLSAFDTALRAAADLRFKESFAVAAHWMSFRSPTGSASSDGAAARSAGTRSSRRSTERCSGLPRRGCRSR